MNNNLITTYTPVVFHVVAYSAGFTIYINSLVFLEYVIQGIICADEPCGVFMAWFKAPIHMGVKVY